MDPRRWLTSAVHRTLAADDTTASRSLLELLAVSGLAVAQPVLDVIGKSQDIFVVRDAGWADVVLFVAIVVLGPPLVGWVLELLAGLVSRRLRHVLHLLLLSAFAVLFAIQVVKQATDLGWKRVLVVAVVAGVGLVALVMNARPIRSWLRLLAVFPLVLAVVFLLSSPARDVVFDRGSEAADVTVEDPAPVVMVVLDELPLGSLLDADGGIDSRQFPNFAELAAGSTWYRNHTTVAPTTIEAVPAILTGRWPGFGQPAPTAATYPENLFTLLGREYSLNVHELGTRLCPPSLCHDRAYGALPELLGDARDVWTSRASPEPTEDVLDVDVGGDPGDDVSRAADVTAFTEELGRSGALPRLDYIHAFLPHGGWTFLPSGARYVGPHPPVGTAYLSWRDDFAAAAGRSRHLLQLQFTDRLLGDLLDRLRELGTYDESLVVVTADHGVSFRAGETLRAATPATYPDVMWTPTFVKAPGQTAGQVVEEPSRSIDVLPTIADHLGVDLPWRVDGSSLLRPRRSSDDVRILAAGIGYVEAAQGYQVFDGVDGYRQAVEAGGAVPPDPLGVYRIGRYGGLVGTPLEEVGSGEGGRLTGHLDHRDAFVAVDPDADELPVYVTGTVTAEHPVDVVVAVNGVVAGWCATAAAGGPDDPGVDDHPFWMVIPESLLRPGNNDVRVYEVTGPADDPQLLPVALE